MKKMISLLALVLIPIASVAATNSATSKADNSARNEKDAKSNTLTPVDQMRGNKSDVEYTRQIRKLIVNDPSLSTMAHNIKIITLNGVATLRGPVESFVEREKIAALAKQVVSDGQLRNQIEVKTQDKENQ
jgi:hyperosmotically inducible periplasmic protein